MRRIESMRRKGRRRSVLVACLLSIVMACSSILPLQGILSVQAEEVLISAWEAEDFVYTDMSQTLNGCDYSRTIVISGKAIAGFSDSGMEKIQSNKRLVLPSKTPDGEVIIGVSDGAFKEQGIEAVTFPEGAMVEYDDTVTNTVTRRGNFLIGASAFYKNSLTNLNLPEGVIMIGPSAFARNQLTSVSLPHTFWWLENSAFAYNQLETVDFPQTCDFQAQIHAFAFAHNQIKSVRLPDYLEVVEKKAFYWNPGMENCPDEAPDQEKEWGGVVYMYTDNDKLLNMERIHHLERTVESQKSWHQKLILGQNPEGNLGWSVEDFTFDGTKVTGLSESGIEKRKTNRNLVIPSYTPDGQAVTELADAATTTGYGLFGAEGEEIESVKLPATLTRIGMKAFAANHLTSVSLPNGLKEIGVAAFQMNQLTAAILPDTVTTLGGGAFGSNPTLEKIYISKSLTEIPTGAFGCSDGKNWMEKLTEIQIPEGITKIGNNAFAGNNFTSIQIPDTVTEIGSYAFSTKNYLMKETATTVRLPEGLVKIGNRAFRNKAIDEVILPTTVTKLYNNTFEKEFSDGAETVRTKVILQSKAQYDDKKNFPLSDYHTYILRVEGQWNAEDFTFGKVNATLYPVTDSTAKVEISGVGVTGFSEIGLTKLETNKHVVIPSVDIEGNPVIGIGAKAFYKLAIESVQFPEGVMSDQVGTDIQDGRTSRGNFIILDNAFYGTKLTEVHLPEGVIYVAKNAFASSAIQTVTLPHTIWWIGQTAFSKNQIKEVVFPETCDYKLNMDAMAFAVNQIKAVRLPDRTEKVANSVFLQNTGMEPVVEEATSAQKKGGVVYMYTGNEGLKEEAFIAHYDREGSATTATGTRSYVQKLIVEEMPEELQYWNAVHFSFEGTVITGFSESGKKKLEYNKNVLLPEKTLNGETVTAIGVSAFAGASDAVTDMEQVVIPDTITEIGNMAFNWTNLSSVTIPDSVTTLGVSAFGNNANLSKVTLSKNAAVIPQACFTSSSIKELVIPEGVTTIGRGAFQGAKVEKLSLPSTVTLIDRDAFSNHQLKELVIPDSVETIGRSAFAIVQEGLDASLTSVTLGTGVTKIDNTAFRGCAITEVEIPFGLTTLHKDAFKECGQNKVIVYTANTAHLNSTTGVISEGTNHSIVYQPLVGSGWTMSDFTFEGTTITGWSEKGNKTRLKNKQLVLPITNPAGDPITAIGAGAFKIPDTEWEQGKDHVISPNGMESVVFPETLVSIGAEAFRYNNLTQIIFPETLAAIGESAFNSNKLQKVVLMDSIKEVGAGAFSVNDITELRLSKSVEEIAQGCFSMNIHLSEIQLPDTVKVIGDMAFAGARLESLEIPASVVKIGRKAFHLHHIQQLTIPGNVKEIGDSAFEGTAKMITLKSLVLEEGVETIGTYAFKEGYLEEVYLPNSIQTLGKDPFINNVGTNNDYVVVLHTENPEHVSLTPSEYHKVVLKEKTPVQRFDDVPVDAWFFQAVEYVAQAGIMTGLTETTFGPVDPLARAQLAVMLWRMEGCPEVEEITHFVDMNEKNADNSWYYDAVMWAASKKIVTGYEVDRTFRPGVAISRQEIATMLYRYANYRDGEVTGLVSYDSYPDAKHVQNFAKEPMQWAVGNGLIRGNNGLLDPSGSAVRAQSATITQRFLEMK